MEEIRVGIAEYRAAPAPWRITTIGLGSCVGVALYDYMKKIGGLAHIMLPYSSQFSNISKPEKFADLAIPMLLEEMESMGANRRNITAKICGGASMFNFPDKNLIMDIGSRNVKAVKEILSKLSIPLRGEDTGGNRGRTITLDAGNGKIYIKRAGRAIIEI